MTSADQILFDWAMTTREFPWVVFKFIRENRIQQTATIRHICADFMLKYRVLVRKQEKLKLLGIDDDAHWNPIFQEIDWLFRDWQTALSSMTGKTLRYVPQYRRWKFQHPVIEDGKIITPGTWKIL